MAVCLLGPAVGCPQVRAVVPRRALGVACPLDLGVGSQRALGAACPLDLGVGSRRVQGVGCPGPGGGRCTGPCEDPYRNNQPPRDRFIAELRQRGMDHYATMLEQA